MLDVKAPIAGNEVLMNFEKSSQAWLENSPVCTKVIDPDFNLLYMSRAGICALEIENIEYYYGKPFPLEFYPKVFKDSMYQILHEVKKSRVAGKHEGVLYNNSKKELWFESTISPIFDDDGELDYFMVVSIEISKQKQAEIKDMMLKEIHHRIKNNLQVVSSLLSLQSYEVNDSELKRIIENSQQRISAISLVHEKIYQSSDSHDIEVKSYVEDLVANISSTYSTDEISIRKEISIDDFELNMDTLIPCSLILNEIITNTFKYGFQENSDPCLHINIKKIGNEITMLIADNGPGLAKSGTKNNESSLGMQIIKTLASQIKASIQLESAPNKGLSYSIKFKL